MSIKKDKLLYIITGFLLILYLCSFIHKNSDKRQMIKTVLVNPKNAESISEFMLTNAEASIHLTKVNNEFWNIENTFSGISMPANSQRIKNFIDNLTTVINVYKISDEIKENNSFGLLNSSTFNLHYVYDQGIHDLYFGNQNFALDSRFLMTDKNTAVYEINDFLDLYLNTSVQNWSDPYLISQEVLGKLLPEDIQTATLNINNINYKIDNTQKLLELRHGGLPEDILDINNKNPELSISLELGNKNKIVLKIFETKKENEFYVKSQYFNRTQKYEYYSKISSWTYSKLKELAMI